MSRIYLILCIFGGWIIVNFGLTFLGVHDFTGRLFFSAVLLFPLYLWAFNTWGVKK